MKMSFKSDKNRREKGDHQRKKETRLSQRKIIRISRRCQRRTDWIFKYVESGV